MEDDIKKTAVRVMPINFGQALEQAGDIIETVVRVMLPLEDDSASRQILEKATWLIFEIISGKESENVARRKLGEYLDSIGYHAPEGKRGKITDLRTDERLNLTIKTAVNLSYGYGRWRSKQVQVILDEFPAQEFFRAFDREEHRDWLERWKAAGGRFFAFTGKESYPTASNYEGRMIAVKNERIWEEISAFGEPYPPFDFNSGMDVRDIRREEAIALRLWTPDDRIYPAQRSFERDAGASVRELSPEMQQVLEETVGWTPEDGIELGVKKIDQVVQPTALSASGEFKERLASKLRKNLAKLEADEERRLLNPLNFGTGSELLRLAEEKIDESEKLSHEQIQEIISLVEKAVERGVGKNPDDLLADGIPYAALLTGISQCRSLAFIYQAINEPKQAMFYGQKATKLELARLMSRGSSYDLVKTAEGLLASAQEMTPETAKQILIFIERAFKKGVGEKYNLRAKAHKALAQTYARTQEPDKAEANRMQYIENADGFLLLEDAKTALATIGGTIESETSAQILDMLAKAVQRLPENCPNLHAEAYRATAEILEALGDNEHAVEYYEYALLKNPKIGVKRRMDALKKPASGIDKNEEIIRQCVEVIRSEQRASVSLLQRRLRLGYTDATRIMDELESRGIVGPSKGAEPRDILIDVSMP